MDYLASGFKTTASWAKRWRRPLGIALETGAFAAMLVATTLKRPMLGLLLSFGLAAVQIVL